MRKFFAVALCLLCCTLACNAQSTRASWRPATEPELKSLFPARAPVVQERSKRKCAPPPASPDGKGHYIAAVVLITAGYSADGKYSHFFITQVPLKIGDFRSPRHLPHRLDPPDGRAQRPLLRIHLRSSHRLHPSPAQLLHHSRRIVSRLAAGRPLDSANRPIHLPISNRRIDLPMQSTNSDKKDPAQAAARPRSQLADRDERLLHLSGARRARLRPIRRQTLRHMADAEAQHAASWASRIHELGGATPKYHGRHTGDADSLSNRMTHGNAIRRLEIDESRAIALYSKQLQELNDEPSLAILRQVLEEEREHYRELSSLIRHRYPRHAVAEGRSNPKALLNDLLAKRDNRGRQAAGGSATPSTASMTDSGQSSESSRESPAQPPATATTCCSPGSPA